jgi:hypothetical protein
MNSSDHSDTSHELSAAHQLVLRELSSRQIAALIRSLDSRLTGIDYSERGGEPTLIYSFDVAGRQATFGVPARALVSIADLYPEAAARERELQQQYGLTFRQPSEEYRPLSSRQEAGGTR